MIKGLIFATHIQIYMKKMAESDSGGSSETKHRDVTVSSPTCRRNDVVIGLSKHQA